MTTARSSAFGWRCRLALRRLDQIAGLIIQNGDIYADAFGPKYDVLKKLWDDPGAASRRQIAEHVTFDGFKSEFIGELPRDIADRISPDLWALHWSLMSTPARLANTIRLLEDQPSTLRDVPDASLHLLGGGHLLLETHLGEVVPLVEDFLTSVEGLAGSG